MKDLAEIIKQAEADVAAYQDLADSADARVVAAQADSAAAHAKLSEGRIVLDWLRQHNGAEPAAAPPASQADPQSQPTMRFGKPVPEGPSKLQQLIDTLGDLGGTGTNKQISSGLARKGVDMKPDHVRGLLKYESHKPHPQVVTEPGSGLWRLTGAGGAR